LGTDDLGRDRFSRLLYASRASVLLAPATALLAIGIATTAGVIAGYCASWLDSLISAAIDLFLSLPWLFAILTLRALLPLNVSAAASMIATAALIASVGWAPAARVIRSGVLQLRDSPVILHARATGVREWRLFVMHLAPALRPLIRAQFWILVPVFLITEANLGILGLGVAEPVPSLGGMLAELQHFQRIPEDPCMLAPAVVVIGLAASLRLAISGPRAWE
jgi:ABC-type dipeptide/oligopeptide/nickel transport system permease subunit